jgi:putative restriction endonuclease
LFDEVAQQILEEPAVVYQAQVAVADEEELFVRSGVFKRVVPRVYNHTCCISGMRLTTTRSVQMIDACHIKPFSESHDDTIGNGISLCPNLHRAFDRFLISIDADYRVRMAEDVLEEGDYGLRQFEGREILLPAERRFWPGRENLEWHWGRFAG